MELQPAWTTAIFRLLVLASIIVAMPRYRRNHRRAIGQHEDSEDAWLYLAEHGELRGTYLA